MTDRTDLIPTEDQPDRNLLDTSGSMSIAEDTGGKAKIVQLIEELEAFLTTGMHEDSLLDGGINRLQVNGEIAIGAFREEVENVVDVKWLELAEEPVMRGSHFYYVQDVTGLRPEARDQLVAKGRTPMAEAIEEALDVIESRKDSLLEDGLTHECRPNLYLLTDGESTSSIDAIAERLHEEELENRVLFWAFGTRKCKRDQLLTLADKSGITPEGKEWSNCIFLGKRSLGSVLKFVNRSMRHQPGGATEAPPEEIYSQSNEYQDDDDMHPE